VLVPIVIVYYAHLTIDTLKSKVIKTEIDDERVTICENDDDNLNIVRSDINASYPHSNINNNQTRNLKVNTKKIVKQ
jgi:hypothetical protein